MTSRNAILALLFGLTAPAVAGGAERILVLPLENVARSPSGRAVVMALLELDLARKGFEVVSGPVVEEFLRQHRIRYLDSIPTSQVKGMLDDLGANALLVGSLLVYDAKRLEGEVALSLRMVGPDGATVWSALGGLSSADTVGAFKQGRLGSAAELSRRLVGEMMSSLPPGKVPLGSEVRGGMTGGGPHVYRSRELAGRKLEICVLPLQNRSPSRTAARAMEAILQERLAEHGGIRLVPPADLRKAVLETGLRAPSRLSAPQLARLGKALGTSLFLQGTILQYGQAYTDLGDTPTVEIYLSLVDAETGRTLWSGLHRRVGLDYQGLFKLGAINAQSTLASRTVAELLSSFIRD
jgi:hypothetical protein